MLAYRVLPTDEPRWRESGAIKPGKFMDREGRRVTIAPCLQLARGDDVAHVRLPAFPARALADWRASRHYGKLLERAHARLGKTSNVGNGKCLVPVQGFEPRSRG